MLIFQEAVGNFGVGSKFVHREETFVIVRPMREVWVRRHSTPRNRTFEAHKGLTVFVTRTDGQRATVRSYVVLTHSEVAKTLRKWTREQGVSPRDGMYYLHFAGMARSKRGSEIDFFFDHNGEFTNDLGVHLGLSISHIPTK